MNIYDFMVKAQDGTEVSISEYRGKVLLIVNTATGCGFTPHYEDLQALYDECHDKGLEILDFPCNQFGNQAPGSDEEINSFCTLKYSTTFPRFAKIDVIGENATPLYRWLSENTTFEGFKGAMGIVMKGIAKKMDKDYKNNGNVKWNFTKFLIDREGNIVGRYEPTVPMKDVAEAVKRML